MEIEFTEFAVALATDSVTLAVALETESTVGGITSCIVSAALSTILSTPVFVGVTLGIESIVPVADPEFTEVTFIKILGMPVKPHRGLLPCEEA